MSSPPKTDFKSKFKFKFVIMLFIKNFEDFTYSDDYMKEATNSNK
jgi:hypothetical protein